MLALVRLVVTVPLLLAAAAQDGPMPRAAMAKDGLSAVTTSSCPCTRVVPELRKGIAVARAMVHVAVAGVRAALRIVELGVQIAQLAVADAGADRTPGERGDDVHPAAAPLHRVPITETS